MFCGVGEEERTTRFGKKKEIKDKNFIAAKIGLLRMKRYLGTQPRETFFAVLIGLTWLLL